MISVIIPFYRNEEQLKKCREALDAQEVEYDLQVIDDSASGHGFTHSVNKGLKAVLPGTGFVVVLNQDCYLLPGALKAMQDFMHKHPKCGVAGIKQLSSSNQDFIIHGGTQECFPAGRHDTGYVSKGDHSVNKRVPWVNGACMIFRPEALQEVGILDKNMRMICSDADWSYRARAVGWECWYIADAWCVHEQGVTSNPDEKMQRVFEADSVYFQMKWLDDELYRDLSLEVF